MNAHLPFLLILFLLLGYPVVLSGQADNADFAEEDDLQPFRQGRWLAGIQGFITSTNSTLTFSPLDSINFASSHSLELRGGYLVADRIPVGILLGTSRQSSREQFKRDVEELIAGVWARYYLSSSRAALYPELGVFFANYFEKNQFQNNGLQVKQQISGLGFGVAVGLGFSYVVADILVFNVALDNNYLFLFGTLKDEVAQTSLPRDFSRLQFRFSVGFNVLIRK